METKAIRFEKGENYTFGALSIVRETRKYFAESPTRFTNLYECLKSFTVTITITEDGE